jgi:hypothetical protein
VQGSLRVKFEQGHGEGGLSGWTSQATVDGGVLLEPITKAEAETIITAMAAMRGEETPEVTDEKDGDDAEEEEEEGDGEEDAHAGLYSVQKRCAVRKSASIKSAKIGTLDEGEELVVTLSKALENGILRLRLAKGGWVSLANSDGDVLMEKLAGELGARSSMAEEEEEEVTKPPKLR